MDARDSTNHDRPAHATMYALFESGILVILALSIFYHSEVAIIKTSIKELINLELPQSQSRRNSKNRAGEKCTPFALFDLYFSTSDTDHYHA